MVLNGKREVVSIALDQTPASGHHQESEVKSFVCCFSGMGFSGFGWVLFTFSCGVKSI